MIRFARQMNLCKVRPVEKARPRKEYGVASPDVAGLRPVLELRSVSLSFGEHCVFENVNLTVYEGETLVLVGPSGQGKSSLLKLLAGILTPTRGTLLVEGKEFHRLSSGERDRLRKKMGMLFQKNALFDS